MQALLKAKDRATESTKSPSEAASIETSAPPQQPVVNEPVQKTDQPTPAPEKVSKSEQAAPEKTTSTTTSLLERKKAIRKKRE